MALSDKRLTCADYHVAWICPLADVELLPARLMLDKEHPTPLYNTHFDENTYVFGLINGHAVVIATCPLGETGNVNAGRLTGSMFKTFPNIRMAILVGIGGGIPRQENFENSFENVHLGDVVIGWPGDGKPACVYHERGRWKVNGDFEMQGTMQDPEWRLTQALSILKSDHQFDRTTFHEQLAILQGHKKFAHQFAHPGLEHDRLFEANYHHSVENRSNCKDCDISKLVKRPPRAENYKNKLVFHQGRIATGNSVIQNGERRDQIRENCPGALCIETEAAGVNVNRRCLVIRGISDYADSHKHDIWRSYAAGNAAAFTRELLCRIQPEEIKKCANTSADRNLSEGLPVLRSDSIFLQERLLVCANVQSFLTEALSCSGHVRVILHGLPGIGKSTMARSFAYNAQKTMAILWIPGNSETAIKQAFEQYARQICGNDHQYSEPMSLIASQLSERFSGQWLVVFDGLDVPFINIQQYLFADLGDSKILITTRNKDLALYIKATHVLQMNPLNEQTGQDLLNMYMNTNSASLTAGQAVQGEQTPQETDAIRRIVKELGGLPLAIAIVGAALRKESAIPTINSQAYLAWADEVKDILLEQDPVFSDYSSSVWKAFQFAFQSILQGTGINQYAAFMAHFAASCENASNLAEYIRLYRKFRTSNTVSTRSAATQGRSVIGQLRFLEIGFFELAMKALAAVNMVTVNWMEGGPDDAPYIEMHSLVRRWLGSTNHDKVFTYTGSKMWLLGFGMYDQLNGSQVGASRFEPLLKEVSETLIKIPRVLDDSQVPASEAVFPPLLDAQIKLSKSIDFLPAKSAQRSRLHQFSRALESEITNSYDDNLKDISWNSVFQDWARELGEQVECAVGFDAKKHDYKVKDFFLDTLDSHGCIPIAFGSEAPYELHYVGQTDTIEKIKADITAQTESLLVEHLAQEAFRQLPAIAPNEPSAFIRTWSKRWEKNVTEVIRNCLVEVFVKLQSATDTQHLATELPSPSNSAAVVRDQNFGGYLQSMLSSSDPRNAFFAVLRRTVKAATGQFLESCPAVETLNEQKNTFGDICERAIREGFGDRVADAFHSQPLSAEAETDTVFSMLWELAWPRRFPGDLDNLIAAQTFNAISNDLKNAAKQGFSNTFENYLYDGSSFVEKLAYEVFSASEIDDMFPNWILSGWIDPPSDDEDSDDEEPTYINLMHESKQQTMSAMKNIYDDRAIVADENTTVQALKSTFDCRKVIHDEVMYRLNQPELTDRTGMGPFFAKMHFEDCDRSLRLAYSVLQHGASEDFVGSLDHMIHVENAWNL